MTDILVRGGIDTAVELRGDKGPAGGPSGPRRPVTVTNEPGLMRLAELIPAQRSCLEIWGAWESPGLILRRQSLDS